MAFADLQSRRATAIDAQWRTYGEPVALPGGAAAEGIFYPDGEPAVGPMGSEVGLVGRLSAQPNPVLLLRDADALLVSERDTVSVRGASYVVSAIRPYGEGRRLCELMPTNRNSADTLAKYR